MGLKGLPFGQLQVEKNDIQPAFRRNTRILLAQGACRCIPRVGEERFAVRLTFGIEFSKHRFGHIYLAAHDQVRQLFRQLLWKRANRAQIFCHVLAGSPVAARRAAYKASVAVLQRHGKAIHLGLYTVFHRWELFAHMAVKLLHLLCAEHILQTLQRYLMHDRRKRG